MRNENWHIVFVRPWHKYTIYRSLGIVPKYYYKKVNYKLPEWADILYNVNPRILR